MRALVFGLTASLTVLWGCDDPCVTGCERAIQCRGAGGFAAENDCPRHCDRGAFSQECTDCQLKETCEVKTLPDGGTVKHLPKCEEVC